MTNKELIQNFEKLVQEERRVTREVLEHIAEIESRRAYFELGFDGMYSYLTHGLGYSEGSAYRRLQAARVLRAKPAVAEKIEAGSLNLMQLTEVAKLSRQTNREISTELLAKLESQSKTETQQILAEAFDLPKQVETKSRVQIDRSVRLEITLSKEQYAQLQKAKELLSHICPDGDIATVIAELAYQHIKRFEVKKTANNHQNTKSPPVAKPCVRRSGPLGVGLPRVQRIKRQYISIHLKREIFSRSQGQCEHFDPRTKRRCQSRYQPQIDHIHPVSLGGSNHPENLQLLCGSHNRAKKAD